MHRFKTCTLGVASLLIAGFGATAPAQEKASDGADLDSMMLEEIIVTARRREESAQTVPVAVTAITADDLISRSALVLSDIAKETPGLTLQARVGDNNTQVAQLRGQIQTDSVPTLDPSVGLYLNDIYVSRNNGANFELFDVERVEVLAGPQGTLYGRNTTGGAIKLVTTPADLRGKYNGYAVVSGGNYNARRIEGAVNIPVSDNFAVRVAALDTKRDGYTKTNVGTLGASPLDPLGLGFDGSAPFTVDKVVDTDNKNTTAARVSALFAPTDKLTFSLVSDYSKQATNGTLSYDQGNTVLATPPGSVLGPLLQPVGNYTKCSDDFYTSCVNFAPKSNAETYGVSLLSAYETPIGTAKVIYGHRSADGFYQTDFEGSPLAFNDVMVATKVAQDTVETQLQGQAASFDYTAGLYYFKETGGEDLTGITFLGVRVFDSEVDNESKSVYGQVGYSLTQNVRLTAGARYTEDKKGLVNSVFFQPGSAVAPLGLCILSSSGFVTNPSADNCQNQRSDTFNHLSWTVGLDWQPRDNILAYIKASDGYRSGGQNLRGVNPATQEPFDEETIRDVELGVKSLLGDRVRMNLTYYHSNYSDIQTTVFLSLAPPQGTTTAVINQGTAKIDGLELQSMLLATDNVSFDVMGSYTNVNYSLPDVIAQYSPKYKASIGANFFAPTSFGDWNARLSYSYQAEFNNTNSELLTDSIPEVVSGGRGLVDGRIGFNIKDYDMSVALFGTNLTNKEYVEVVLPFVQTTGPSGPVTFFNRVQVGQPRMFGLELRKRF